MDSHRHHPVQEEAGIGVDPWRGNDSLGSVQHGGIPLPHACVLRCHDRHANTSAVLDLTLQMEVGLSGIHHPIPLKLLQWEPTGQVLSLDRRGAAAQAHSCRRRSMADAAASPSLPPRTQQLPASPPSQLLAVPIKTHRSPRPRPPGRRQPQPDPQVADSPKPDPQLGGCRRRRKKVVNFMHSWQKKKRLSKYMFYEATKFSVAVLRTENSLNL